MAVEEVHPDGAVRPYSSEKQDVERIDIIPDSPPPTVLQNYDGESVAITWKTWFVIFVLSSTFGLSFWPVPTTAALQGKLSLQFNDPTSMAWYVPAYTTGNAIGFLIAGANSDLFGRRLFLLFGNACCCVGFIITATSGAAMQFTAGLAITGFGGGFCQMAMCSIPELLPNKFRHIGICISDGFVFLIVIIGPIVGRVSLSSTSHQKQTLTHCSQYAIDSGGWKYIYWGGFVAQFFSLAAIFAFYKPPKHPKGIPWHEAWRGLDYVGSALIIPGICLVLVGIVNTTYKSSSDITVIAPLVVGFVLIAGFGAWETWSSTPYKLCPPHLFASHGGREFTAPFIVAFIVTMFYYSVNIIW